MVETSSVLIKKCRELEEDNKDKLDLITQQGLLLDKENEKQRKKDDVFDMLVGALKDVIDSDTSSLFSIDFETGESERVAGLVPKEIAEKALAAAKELECEL